MKPNFEQGIKKTARLHRQVTRNNTPRILPVPTLIEPVLPLFPKVRFIEDSPPRRLKRNAIPAKDATNVHGHPKRGSAEAHETTSN
jgi:hypothetical protein